MILRDFKEHLRAQAKSKYTIYQFCSDVKMYFKKYRSFSTINVQKFIDAQILNGKDPKTAYGKSLSLKHYGKFIGQPLGKLSVPKTKRRIDKINVISESEIIKTREWMNRISKSDGYEANRDKIILLLLNIGLRRGEVLSIKVQDVDFNSNHIKFVGKGSKGAFASMYNRAGDIRDYIELRNSFNPETDNLLMCKYWGTWKRMNAKEFYDIVQRRTTEILNKYVNPHAFRHTFATLMLDDGADLRVVQEGLRHSSIVTTQVYTHVSTERVRSEVEKHHPLFR